MGIVLLALKKPYTFVVMAVLMVLLGVASIGKMPVDILPDDRHPRRQCDLDLSRACPRRRWRSASRPTASMPSRPTSATSRPWSRRRSTASASPKSTFIPPSISTRRSRRSPPSARRFAAIMPTSVQPPIILQFSASSVPILQMSLSSKTMSESEVYDYGLYRIRQQLAVVQGATLPTPYGGKLRQIMVDLDPQALQAKGLSPRDVSDAITAQNLTLPTGNARIGKQDYPVSLNSSPTAIQTFNDIPIKQVDGVDGLYARCRAGPRRLRRADQHRPAGRHARRAAHHPEERQRLHAGRRQSDQGAAAADPRGGSQRS